MPKAKDTNGKRVLALTVRFDEPTRQRLHAYSIRLAQGRNTRVSYSAAIKQLIGSIPDRLLDPTVMANKHKPATAH
jgi:hypothetical protein